MIIASLTVISLMSMLPQQQARFTVHLRTDRGQVCAFTVILTDQSRVSNERTTAQSQKLPRAAVERLAERCGTTR